jgi:hypothetical protein
VGVIVSQFDFISRNRTPAICNFARATAARIEGEGRGDFKGAGRGLDGRETPIGCFVSLGGQTPVERPVGV